MIKKTTQKEIPSQKIMAPSYRAILIAKVDGYKERAGIKSDRVLNIKVFGTNEGVFMGKLRDGGNFTMEKAERLERWLANAEAMLAGAVEPRELSPAMKEAVTHRAERKAKAAVSRKPKAKVVDKTKEYAAAKARRRAKPTAEVVDLKTKRVARKKAVAG